MLGVDERADTSALLGFGDDMKGERGFTRGFWSEDFDDSPLGQSADAECCVESERASRNSAYTDFRTIAKFHDRAFAEFSLNGFERAFDAGEFGFARRFSRAFAYFRVLHADSF